ncbi:acyl-CoA dehydrogenase family member 11-like [Halichondria panicea]|uniref:acyl-CoA dehydrogenase family member 11-like n=1 Tax=Halichondria panicea TaxID=6063 RepID=UPI00312B48DB
MASALFRFGQSTTSVCTWLQLGRLLSTRTRRPNSFSRSRMGSFTQPMPQLHNPFRGDIFLRAILTRLMPREVSQEVFIDLDRFGGRLVDEVDALGKQAELEPPYLRPFNAWGDRVDELVTSPAWKSLHCVSAEEGLIALAYERQHGQWSRLHQVAKLYLFSPSSGLYSCPLAMTDGAARLIEESNNVFLKKRAFCHLTARDPESFWTSGQWMTEKRGGSDVAGGTDTVAYGPDSEGNYSLHGYKWFTSATDANMAFTLARIVTDQGDVTAGSQGLSLFYVETKTEDGQFNDLEIQRLKDKLGTRQLPTAELLLDGTKARLVGEEGRGVSGISPMLTITRQHNSISAAGAMRRIVQLSRDYATRRRAFGKLLVDQHLHMQTLARMEVETRACTVLMLEVARLQGLIETSSVSEQDRTIHRILTPILKLYTAKQAVAVCSEGLESFGGQGYMEDTGLPTYLRDAQVLPIWEGTTNILSLDVLRVMQKYGQEALSSLFEATKSRLSDDSRLAARGLGPTAKTLREHMNSIVVFGQEAMVGDSEQLQNASRDLSFSLAHVFIGGLLIEHACSVESSSADINAAKRWAKRPLSLRLYQQYSKEEQSIDSALVMNGYVPSTSL